MKNTNIDVPIKTDSKRKAEILNGLKEAIAEMKLIKEGKLKGISAAELLDELSKS